MPAPRPEAEHILSQGNPRIKEGRNGMSVFLWSLFGAGGALGALATFAKLQGDCEILLETEAAHGFRVELLEEKREICCSCLVPLVNRGRQQGMVLNVFCRPEYWGKIMEKLEVSSYLKLAGEAGRKDTYWEALILKKGARLLTELTLRIRSEVELAEVLREVPRAAVAVYYQVTGRTGMRWHLAELSFPLRGGTLR